METPKISIITVVRNAETLLERTILSVLGQTYKNYEYILIDGYSDDGTLSLLEKYRSHFSVLVSEEDTGLYDAMNKGLNLARGEYLVFLNAGDEWFDSQTLEHIFSRESTADLLYGKTMMVDEVGAFLGTRNQIPEKLRFHSFRYGTTVSHQAFIVKRSLCPQYRLEYKISSDIDWMLQILKKNPTTQAFDRHLIKYLHGGLNKQHHRKALQERFCIFVKNYGCLPTLFFHLVIVLCALYHALSGKKRYT